MPRAIRELLLLLIIAAIPASLAGWLQPNAFNREAAVPFITVAEAHQLQEDASVMWIDARSEAAFAQGHIPGAIRLTEDDWESLILPVMDAWTPGQTIVVYCDLETCNASVAVAARLRRELQIETVRVLKGGWSAWLQANQR